MENRIPGRRPMLPTQFQRQKTTSTYEDAYQSPSGTPSGKSTEHPDLARAPSTKSQTLQKFIPLNDVAELLGIPVFKLRRAERAGLFPSYRIWNSRKLVRLSEVIAAIEASRDGARK